MFKMTLNVLGWCIGRVLRPAEVRIAYSSGRWISSNACFGRFGQDGGPPNDVVNNLFTIYAHPFKFAVLISVFSPKNISVSAFLIAVKRL